jgi:acyl-CoA thioesterase YciA
MKNNHAADSLTGERYLAIKVVMMPRDTNPHGTIFGGVILSYIDLAGAVGATHQIRQAGWPEQPIVSVAMASVEFHRPVFVGDMVSFWTRLVRVGNTSITMRVDTCGSRS